jgi:Rrf2 family protein
MCNNLKVLMSSSQKLSTAVKALCFLAKVFPDPKTSGEIAEAIGVNASKLRQILSSLMKADIVGSTKGVNGGFFLTQDFTELSLYEIYSALEDRKIMDLDVADAGDAKDGEVQNYNNYFYNFYANIQKQIEAQMKEVKLNQIKDGETDETIK